MDNLLKELRFLLTRVEVNCKNITEKLQSNQLEYTHPTLKNDLKEEYNDIICNLTEALENLETLSFDANRQVLNDPINDYQLEVSFNHPREVTCSNDLYDTMVVYYHTVIKGLVYFKYFKTLEAINEHIIKSGQCASDFIFVESFKTTQPIDSVSIWLDAVHFIGIDKYRLIIGDYVCISREAQRYVIISKHDELEAYDGDLIPVGHLTNFLVKGSKKYAN